MVLHIFFHSQEQVIPVFVIIICRNILIFFPGRFKYLQIPFFISGDLFRIRVTGQPGLIPEVDHFLYQTMHFFIPGTVRLIIHAVFQVPQYMGKTFLMVCPIIIKSDIMVMDKDTLTEELGADAFHYKTRNLYLFIYDKEDIIKNPEAYKMAFHRDSQKDGKDIRVFITRPY